MELPVIFFFLLQTHPKHPHLHAFAHAVSSIKSVFLLLTRITRDAEKGETFANQGNATLAETKSAFHRDQGEAPFIEKFLTQVPDWFNCMQMWFPKLYSSYWFELCSSD